MIILSILICTLYSISDEFHQLFISGRSGKITDCIYDIFGSTIGISIVYLINRKNITKRLEKSNLFFVNKFYYFILINFILILKDINHYAGILKMFYVC